MGNSNDLTRQECMLVTPAVWNTNYCKTYAYLSKDWTWTLSSFDSQGTPQTNFLDANNTRSFRLAYTYPSVYLKSNVKYVSGTGTSIVPIIIEAGD